MCGGEKRSDVENFDEEGREDYLSSHVCFCSKGLFVIYFFTLHSMIFLSIPFF